MFGLNLPENESLSFLILAGGSLGSALGFAALQEGVFRIPGFKFGAWMTILSTFTYFLCGALEMKLTGDSRKASWKNYGILSVYTYGGMAMTNYALSYLNYALACVQVREDHSSDGFLRPHRRQEVRLEGVALRRHPRRGYRALHPR